jgi:hypothetical protein
MVERGALELCEDERGALELREAEARLLRPSIKEDGTIEDRMRKINMTNIGPAQVRARQIAPFEGGDKPQRFLPQGQSVDRRDQGDQFGLSRDNTCGLWIEIG